MALSVEQKDLVDLIRQALARNDRVFAKFWQEVNAVFLREPPGPLTSFRRKLILRDINVIISRYYGSTVEGALSSTLFKEMLASTDSAAALPFQRSIERVKNVIDKSDPTFWGRNIASKASSKSADPFLRVLGDLNGPETQRQRLLRSKALDADRAWVKRERWNTRSGYRLSQRLWKNGRDVRQAIDQRLREGIANGEDALSIARSLESHLNPAFKSEDVTKNGKLIRRNQTLAPGRGDWGNVSARRLARTETTRVHGAAVIEAAKVTPGVIGVRWVLSASHEGQDGCNDNASRDDGFGAGVYKTGDVPPYPEHPNCTCTLTPATKPREQMIDDLIAKYGGD